MDGISLRYLGQAGFLFAEEPGKRVLLDPYLSDCVETHFGFKRMQPAPVSPAELRPDIVLSTHAHLDHLDIDALPAFVSRPGTVFVGAPDCEAVYKSAGLSPERYAILRAGEKTVIGGVSIRAVRADHGELAPEAIGFLLEMGGVRVYNVGDSGPDNGPMLESLGNVAVDVMIVPINGAFGNLDAEGACAFAARVHPAVLIGAHFWMFVEHGGDPARFLSESKRLGLNGVVMAPGETRPIARQTSVSGKEQTCFNR